MRAPTAMFDGAVALSVGFADSSPKGSAKWVRCNISSPLSGGVARNEPGGCIDKQLYRSIGKIANLLKPPASFVGSPLKGGTRRMRCSSKGSL